MDPTVEKMTDKNKRIRLMLKELSDIIWELLKLKSKGLYRRLKKICKTDLSHESAKAFQQRLLDPKKEFNRLFVFLDHRGVDPTNNHAERALRRLVIFRKVCFGTRTDEGAYRHSVLPSLLTTANRQGKHPIEFLQTLFSQNPATAQKELYSDSS